VLKICEFVDAEAKVKITLDAMKRITIPWNIQFQEAIRVAFDLADSHLVDELKENYKLLKFKRMLKKYRLSDINTANLSSGRSMFICSYFQ
jgi:hypothetical protein